MEKETENMLKTATDQCAGCRDCAEGCDHLLSQEEHPGGIAEILLSGNVGDDLKDFILKCSLCGLCRELCPIQLDIPQMVRQVRHEFMKSGINDPDAYRFLWVDHDWNAFTLYRDTYGLNETYADLVKEKCDVLFFPGCMLANESPMLVRDSVLWLSGQGENVGVLLFCCGVPLKEFGLKDRAAQYADRLWHKIAKTGARRVITACPTCHASLLNTKGQHAVEIVSLYKELAASGLKAPVIGSGRVTVHDSCTDRKGEIGGYVRKLLRNYEIIEMTHSGTHTICCGSGGIVSLIDPEICDDRADNRMQEVSETGADICVTYCMACAHRLAVKSDQHEVLHILEVLMGHRVDHEQFNEKANAMWQEELGEKNADRLNGSELMHF
ncbi:MAG: (Fe-S)-binding protein [Pseudomonadota bacterium]